MKSLKVALFGLLIATVGMLAATKASAQVTTKIYEFTGPAFTIGVTAPSQLEVIANWTLKAVQPSCPNSTIKFCSFTITYSGTTHPTLAEILDALEKKYVADGEVFTDGQQFTLSVPVSGSPNVAVTFTIQLKP